jgi:hypothetical protein
MTKEINRTLPGELQNFAYEWRERGKPTNTAFESPLLESSVAISKCHRMRTWRRFEIAQFQSNSHSRGIDAEAANKHFQKLLGMDWIEVDSLMFRVVPHPNKPAKERKIIYYVPEVSDVSLSPKESTHNDQG